VAAALVGADSACSSWRTHRPTWRLQKWI